MILGRLAIALSIATVLALDLIRLLGAGIQDPESIRPIFGGLVMVMDLCLVSSSSQLGFRFARLGNKRPAALFFLNIGLFVVAFRFVVSGVRLHPLLLHTADLYWPPSPLVGEETVRRRGDHMGTPGAVGPPPTATATDWHGRIERSC